MDHNEIISKEEYVVCMPDCIENGGSYQEDIEAAFKLTNGLLNLEKFGWENTGSQFKLDLIVNEIKFDFSVEIMSDYIDADNLVKGLNKVISKIDKYNERQFYVIAGELADVGIAFISIDQIDQMEQLKELGIIE